MKGKTPRAVRIILGKITGKRNLWDNSVVLCSASTGQVRKGRMKIVYRNVADSYSSLRNVVTTFHLFEFSTSRSTECYTWEDITHVLHEMDKFYHFIPSQVISICKNCYGSVLLLVRKSSRSNFSESGCNCGGGGGRRKE